MKTIKNSIMYLWQLPQNILGLILKIFYPSTLKHNWWQWDNVNITVSKKFRSGISLGNYIIVNERQNTYETILHEYGHHLQSEMLGPLYLIVVGLPSLIHNIFCNCKKHNHDYYDVYPERCANKLGAKYIINKLKELTKKYKEYEKANI